MLDRWSHTLAVPRAFKAKFRFGPGARYAITMVFLSNGASALDSLGVGVDLFFVLSGFLIGRIYLRSKVDAHDAPGTFTLWGFWSARWFRTLPPYLSALGLFALAETHFHNNPIHPYYLIFAQNYLGMIGFGPSWSLCVEEHFYLALPLIGFLALRFVGRRKLLWLLPLLALVPQALRTAAVLGGGVPANWYWRTHLHCEGLILGVWLAYLFVDRLELWAKLRRPALPLAVIPVAILIYQNVLTEQPLVFRATVFLLYAVGTLRGYVCRMTCAGIRLPAWVCKSRIPCTGSHWLRTASTWRTRSY